MLIIQALACSKADKNKGPLVTAFSELKCAQYIADISADKQLDSAQSSLNRYAQKDMSGLPAGAFQVFA